MVAGTYSEMNLISTQYSWQKHSADDINRLCDVIDCQSEF